MKTWSPDTCACKIEEIYDGTKIIGGGMVLRKCPAHLDIPDNALYETLMNENQSKNRVHRILLDLDGETDFNLSNTKPDGSKELREDIKYEWSFDEQRNLKVKIHGATFSKRHKDMLNSKCEELCKKRIILDEQA